MTEIINASLKSVLDKQKYDGERVPELVLQTTNDILAKVKGLLSLLLTRRPRV